MIFGWLLQALGDFGWFWLGPPGSGLIHRLVTPNRKGVLKSLSENHRKDDVKKINLGGKQPEERAL